MYFNIKYKSKNSICNEARRSAMIRFNVSFILIELLLIVYAQLLQHVVRGHLSIRCELGVSSV